MENPPGLGFKPSESPAGQNPAENIDPVLTFPELSLKIEVKPHWWESARLGKIVLFGASLYLFILAINFMKSGARGITPFIHDLGVISNATNSLGFGWLLAYLIMSGSPVAAAALTFFDAGVIDELSAFTMITGSRLGASFIVLFVGFIYVLRGRDRATSLSMGILSLIVTATTYLPGLLIGIILLKTGVLDSVQLPNGALLTSVVDTTVEPFTDLVAGFFPYWVIFLIGLGIILISFKLFDKCLPQMTLKESQIGWGSRLVYRPVVMFTLGAMVTMISMSVSISLSLLVPLSQRGFVRRENVIPYIMGANITTFIDTLLAAVLLNNMAAFTVVFVSMLSTAAASILILVFIYRPYLRNSLQFVNWVSSTNRNLAIFMITIFITPVILILI